jgi:hypothetical protein
MQLKPEELEAQGFVLDAELDHMGMCSGDFGLLNYFEIHKDKEVVTYDDLATGLSYFYHREKR